jgi:hypothetical protein
MCPAAVAVVLSWAWLIGNPDIQTPVETRILMTHRIIAPILFRDDYSFSHRQRAGPEL